MADPRKQPSTLVEQVNGVDGTNFYPFVMGAFRFAVFQLILSGGSGTVTATVEATTDPAVTQDDADLEDSTLDWTDITNDVFGVPSITASGNFVFDTPQPWRAFRIKIVAATTGANDADWTIHAGGMT